MGQIQFARAGDPFTEQMVYGSQMLPTRHTIQPNCGQPEETLFCLDHRLEQPTAETMASHVLGDANFHTVLRICPTHGYETLDAPQQPDFRRISYQRRMATMTLQAIQDALLDAWEKLEQA